MQSARKAVAVRSYQNSSFRHDDVTAQLLLLLMMVMTMLLAVSLARR